jgi:hypothetical protein
MKKPPLNIILISTIALLFLLTLSTSYYGSIDIGDYADVAKFFAGNFNAKIRTSHSIVYGLIHAPFLNLTNSLIFMKLSSVLWLSLIIISLYFISNKNKKVLLLAVTTPIIWYMAPWINPIQLSSLLFLWAYYFIVKSSQDSSLKNLVYSGLLLGFSWIFWEAILYFAVILIICFTYDKKFWHILLILLAVFIGVLPKLLIDQIFFGFAFYTTIKHFFAVFSSIFYGGVYQSTAGFNFIERIIDIILVVLMIPFFSYIFFKNKIFKKLSSENKRTIFFLLFSLIIIFVNASQIRYTLVLVPIAILVLTPLLTKKQFQIQLTIFLIISLIVINPYLLQIGYQTNADELGTLVKNFNKIQIDPILDSLEKDLRNLSKLYPNEVFLVGNKPDDYQALAHVYWGNKISEFVSIQDYNLHSSKNNVLASDKLCSKSKQWNRRDICIEISLTKTLSDSTDYDSIKYALSFENKTLDLDSSEIELIQEFEHFSLFRID